MEAINIASLITDSLSAQQLLDRLVQCARLSNVFQPQLPIALVHTQQDDRLSGPSPVPLPAKEVSLGSFLCPATRSQSSGSRSTQGLYMSPDVTSVLHVDSGAATQDGQIHSGGVRADAYNSLLACTRLATSQLPTGPCTAATGLGTSLKWDRGTQHDRQDSLTIASSALSALEASPNLKHLLYLRPPSQPSSTVASPTVNEVSLSPEPSGQHSRIQQGPAVAATGGGDQAVAAARPAAAARTKAGGGMGVGGQKGGRRASTRYNHITVDMLSQSGFLDMPIQEAAKQLGIGLSVLKRVCREKGLVRWPFRKRKSLNNVMQQTKTFLAEDKQAAVLEALEGQLQSLNGTGETFDMATKCYRQACFKLNHKINKLQAAAGNDAGGGRKPMTISAAAAAKLTQPQLLQPQPSV
mmetsp:Transcript_20115/g.60721  ORF Transcript_20115/g.60721 Transcript_20115/m.60721 type:complete len:411 (+) Transcript_20115:414-1646(+)